MRGRLRQSVVAGEAGMHGVEYPIMQIIVSARHGDPEEAEKNYAREKAAKLERFYDRLQSVEVVFAMQSGAWECEFIVRADHNTTFVARESDADAYAAVDAVFKEIERQITRHKERHRNRKHNGARPERAPLGGAERGKPEGKGPRRSES